MADDYGPGFQKAREAALARSNGVCQACGHFRATAAHHWQKRYSPDAEITPDHLTGLCDLCHGMITALRKTLTAAESEKRSEAGEDADRLTERQKSYIRYLFRQGGHHFPDEGFVRIAEALFTRYISGERLEQHHSILLGAWRAEGKRRISDLTKHEADALIQTLKKGDWARPVTKAPPAPEPNPPRKPDSDRALSGRSASLPRARRRWAIIAAFVLAAACLLAYSGEKNTMSVIDAIKGAIHKMFH